MSAAEDVGIVVGVGGGSAVGAGTDGRARRATWRGSGREDGNVRVF